MEPLKVNMLEMTLPDLVQIMRTKFNKGSFHAAALYRAVLKDGNLDPMSIQAFVNSPRLARKLEPALVMEPGKVVHSLSDGPLLKFVTRLSDGLEIESVIVPMARYNTLCISCQVGCRMGCRFCETGAMGFARNLTCAEITGQVFNARHVLGYNVANVVFMGMGEPFDNLEPVFRAVRILTQQQGFDIAPRHITISTAGIIEGIEAMAAMDLPGIRLAVSIHAADNEKRSVIMPINRRVPLETLKKALISYPLSRRGTFLFEYILFKGFNDSRQDARALAGFIRPLKVRLNLMAHNPAAGFEYTPVSDEQLNRFAQWLRQEDIFVVRRWEKGGAVAAACGQLAGRPRAAGSVSIS